MPTGGTLTSAKTTYRPVLLARQGERLALQDLTEEDHQQFTPIFVVPPIAWDYENEMPSKTLEQHLDKLPVELSRARKGYPAFIDLMFLSEETADVHGQHPLKWLYAESAKEGLELIPVVAPSSPPLLIAAARDLASDEQTGVALRLLPADWPSVDAKGFQIFLSDLELSPSEIDLVIDLGPDTSSNLTLRALIPELQWAHSNGSWRSLTIAGAGMPKDLPSGRGVHVIERSDWSTFKSARTSLFEAGESITLDYSDYGVAGSDPAVEINPRFLSISASFRYTTDNAWLLARGELFKANGGRSVGGAAVAPMLRALTAHATYNNSNRNAAHDWIDGVIAGSSGGQPTVWRRWATFHHIKTVLRQLASSSGS